MSIQDQFADLARSCVGTPFSDCGGREKGRGLDCAGTIAWPLKQLGLPYEDKKGYTLGPGTDHYFDIIAGLRKSFRKLPRKIPVKWQRGDVIVYRHRGLPGHCLIYVSEHEGRPIFVEAVVGRTVQERGMATDWIDRLEGVRADWGIWRLKG